MNDTLYMPNETNKYIPATQDIVVNITIIAVSLIVVVWTVIANSVIVLCFVINRKTTWPSFSTQILSLAVSDMCVGLASLPLAVLPKISANLNYGVCSLLFFLFFSSQCASLYHILGICVHRCVVVHSASERNEGRSDFRAPLILITLAWILSLVVNALLHLAYGDPNVVKQECLFAEVFRENVKEATVFLFIVYFVPQTLTTVLYIVACCRLRCVWRKVFPGHITSSTQPRGLASAPNQVNMPSSIASNRSGIRVQRNVIGTIGVLMLIFNICTVPLIVLFKMESQYQKTQRDVRFIASAMFILNSALNPFVYALRTNWLKIALKKMFQDFFITIYPCRN